MPPAGNGLVNKASAEFDSEDRARLAAVNRSTTQQALDDLHDQVSKAMSLFSELNSRLAPITRPRPEGVNKEASDRDSYGSSEIHQQIYEITSRVQMFQKMIMDAHEGVEV